MNTKATLRTLPPAPSGLTYLAIGANCWGKSSDPSAALRNARSHGSPGKYTLHLTNDWSEVDPVDGAFNYKKDTPGLKLNALTVTLR